MDSLFVDSTGYKLPDSLQLRTELELTRQFYRYADRAYQGNQDLKLADLGWFIPRKKVDIVALLDSVVRDNGKTLSDLEPVNTQYNKLKEYLLKYHQLEKSPDWKIISTDKKKLQEGDQDNAVTALKRRLKLIGDFDETDTSNVFTASLTEAVKRYQDRYGLKQDGIVGIALLNEMNRPANDRIKQLLINMERIRWVPAQPTTDYLLVNIPEFKLHAYENGNYAFDMVVVVGSTQHNTVIFSGDLKNIVFSPYWNVPSSILKKEVLPGIQRNKNYLASHNMEWNGNSVRQKPGLKNSLGLVKFLFPNSYDIYFHDTPSKSLFGESSRAFSHGCIRLAEPKKLATWILRNDPNWDDAKITAAMNAGKEKFVVVKQKLPVFIGYFTAWVDRNGKLNFRDDIYGHDKKMLEQLFGKK
jgi:murein L,D-transpeptidase YcbB/YkuD